VLQQRNSHSVEDEYVDVGMTGARSAAAKLKATTSDLVLWQQIDGKLGVTDRLIKGLIGEKSFAVIAGPTGSAKTFLALKASIDVACGWDFFNRKVTLLGVLYIGAEGQAGLLKRIQAVKQRFSIGDTAEVPFALYPAPIDLVTDANGAKQIIAYVEALNEILPVKIGIVVIDTLARCFGSRDENSTQDMNTFVSRCDTIRNATGVAVVVVHHFGKDESKGMRGSIALKAAADTVIEVTGTDGTRTVKVEKQKDGAAGETFAFNLEVVELGRNEDGEPITSCVVIPSDSAPKEKSARAPRLPPAARIAKEALQKAIAEAGQPAPASNHLPANTRGVPVDMWRRYAYQRSISKGECESAKRNAFRRAAETLQANHAVGICDEFAWLT
jgi:hypothetical protein